MWIFCEVFTSSVHLPSTSTSIEPGSTYRDDIVGVRSMEAFQFIHFTTLIRFERITALFELESKQWIVNLPSCDHLALASSTSTRHLLRFSFQP
jgi:hypothetical protein